MANQPEDEALMQLLGPHFRPDQPNATLQRAFLDSGKPLDLGAMIPAAEAEMIRQRNLAIRMLQQRQHQLEIPEEFIRKQAGDALNATDPTLTDLMGVIGRSEGTGEDLMVLADRVAEGGAPAQGVENLRLMGKGRERPYMQPITEDILGRELYERLGHPEIARELRDLPYRRGFEPLADDYNEGLYRLLNDDPNRGIEAARVQGFVDAGYGSLLDDLGPQGKRYAILPSEKPTHKIYPIEPHPPLNLDPSLSPGYRAGREDWAMRRHNIFDDTPVNLKPYRAPLAALLGANLGNSLHRMPRGLGMGGFGFNMGGNP
jgi:hypothetical protein